MPADPARRAPQDRTKLLVITATAPTPNGPLHLGHLSGPYVAADIAARAARARDERVLTVSGLDPHQNYVPAKAQKEGRKADAVLDEYEGLVRRAFAAARVDYDLFADPRADDGYRTAVRALLDELVDRRAVTLQRETLWRCADCGATLHHAYVTGCCPGCGADSGGGTCEGCGGFTTAANLVGARCACCGGPREPLEARIPVLRLEDYRGALTDIWSCAVLPPRVRRLIAAYLADGLPDVPLAYPTDWGIPAAADGQRIDVWAEMGLGLLAGLPRQLDPAASSLDDYVTGWRQPQDGLAPSCWHFLGIDNAFYFAVLFPALFTAAGRPGGLAGRAGRQRVLPAGRPEVLHQPQPRRVGTRVPGRPGPSAAAAVPVLGPARPRRKLVQQAGLRGLPRLGRPRPARRRPAARRAGRGGTEPGAARTPARFLRPFSRTALLDRRGCRPGTTAACRADRRRAGPARRRTACVTRQESQPHEQSGTSVLPHSRCGRGPGQPEPGGSVRGGQARPDRAVRGQSRALLAQ